MKNLCTPAMLSRRAYATYLTWPNGHTSPRPAPRITLHDGETLSVQANRFAYCSPRCNGLQYYDYLEVGFPSFTPTFLSYAEDPDTPTETIYPYVPAQIICDEINAHGGLSFSDRVDTFCRIYTNEYFDGKCS